MNSGQLLLTLGAMFILALVVVRVNNTFLTTNDVMLNTKFGVLAVSLCTSVIEEACGKKFDNNTDTTSIDDVNLLTPPSVLGPESGEVYPNYNDFDDFDGYTRVDSTMPSAIFNILCRVCYVEPSGSSIIEVTHKTWFKKIEITVTSPFWKKTDGTPEMVVTSTIYSYWYAR